MEIPFSKYHGLANDYLFLDAIAQPEISGLPFPPLAIAMSHRRTGPGADGIVVILPSRTATAAMRIFNSDGSEAENCGNALRCLARICRERNYAADLTFRIEILHGSALVFLDDSDSEFDHVGVQLPPPCWQRSSLPMNGDGEARCITLEILGRVFNMSCLSVGNPHCVAFVNEETQAVALQYGPSIENHPLFPKRINGGFCRILSRDRIELTVWERGAGMTGACGTGATAAFAAARHRDLVDHACTVIMPGGALRFLENPDGSIRMSGPATYVYAGTFHWRDHE